MIFKALLVPLYGESIWKGGSAGCGDVHWKNATSRWKEGRMDM